MSKAGYHHGDLRKALIEAALELVEEEGAREVSLREAARRVGVSPGAPYRHFKSRQELMVAVAVEANARFARLAELELEQAGPGPLEAFRAQGMASIRLAAAHPNLFRLMNSKGYIEGLGPEAVEAHRGALAGILSLLEEAQREGLLGAIKPEIGMLAGQALAYGLSRMLIDGHLSLFGYAEDEVVELMAQVAEVLGDGLLPRG